MKNFEFFFNPDSSDKVYNTFCFEPENRKEEKLGNLYMAGITNKDSPILLPLAENIKNEYYKNYQDSSIESLRKSLEKANEFLLSERAKNKVGWLDNLDFTVLAIDPNYHINFVKIGKLKAFILKEDEILNIGTQEEQVNSNNIFQNIITGNLMLENKILILNQDILDLFEKDNILERLTKCSIKSINPIFKSRKEFLKNAFGFCLLIVLTPKKRRLIKISFPKINFPKVYFPKICFSFFSRLIPLQMKERIKRSLISILILIILLILGSFLFR